MPQFPLWTENKMRDKTAWVTERIREDQGNTLRPALHSAQHVGGAQWILVPLVFSFNAPPTSSLRPFPRPFPRPLQVPGGSSAVKGRALCSIAAFYCSVAGSLVARTSASLALRPLLLALYGSVAGAAALGAAVWSWVEGIRVAGVDWDWNHGRWGTSELPGMRVEERSGDHPLTQAGIAGPEFPHITFSHLCPGPGSSHFSCQPGPSLEFLLDSFSSFRSSRPGPLLNFSLGLFSPCPGTWLPFAFLKAPDYLHNHSPLILFKSLSWWSWWESTGLSCIWVSASLLMALWLWDKFCCLLGASTFVFIKRRQL